ncbi:hypothetical protein BGZ65_012623, partial [Modicella reniformis]
MVARSIAIFTGGAVLGAVAIGSYYKSKEGSKAVALTTQTQTQPKSSAPVSLPQVPSPVIGRPSPGTSVGHARSIMPHGIP